MFYQSLNSTGNEPLKFEEGYDFTFPPHLHGSFELIKVTEGEMTVTVDKTVYTLRGNDALLIFPNQVHELATPDHSCHILCIFSPMLVQAFNKVFLTKIPKSNLFTLDEFYVNQLMDLRDNERSIMQIKGLLYSICGEFDKTASYLPKDNDKEELIARIFHFVEMNYNKDCSLATLATEISYHYVYLSKYFKQSTGISFTDYVNRYRVNEACYALQNSSHTILKIAYDCGFDSLRSFNRNFKAVMDMTPSEYRAKF